MTTNSDQPNNPGDQQQPNATDQQQGPQGQAAETVEAEVDIDQEALDQARAEAAAEAEKAAGEGDGAAGAATDQTKQDQQQPPAAQQQPPAGDMPMIPKPRLDEALGKLSKAETDAAYWRGVAEARGQSTAQPQGGQPIAQQQPQAPNAEQRLAALHTEQDALAAKFDNGEITMADLKKAERDLNNREQAIREEILTAKLKPANQAPATAGQPDDLYLNTLTAELETAHPWVKIADQAGTEIDWKYVTDQARQNLLAAGVNVANGNAGKYELRKEVARLWDELGPAIVGAKAKSKGIAIPGAAPQQAPQGQKNTPQQRAKKLDLAAELPPQLSRMTGTTVDDGIPSESRIETMHEDEIGALPEATRRRLLGTLEA